MRWLAETLWTWAPLWVPLLSFWLVIRTGLVLLRRIQVRATLVQHAEWRGVQVRWWWRNSRIRYETIRSFDFVETRWFGTVDLTELIRRHTRHPFEIDTHEYMLAVVRPRDARHMLAIEHAVELARASEEMRTRAPACFVLQAAPPRASP